MNIPKVALSGLLALSALGGGGVYIANSHQPVAQSEPLITEQNYSVGTEQFIPGHTYKVEQRLINVTFPGGTAPATRACYISPADPKEQNYWEHTLVQPNGKHLPAVRENIADPATPGTWKMFPSRAQVFPSGPIDAAICSATYDGGNGEYYVTPSFVMKTDPSNPQNPPTVDQLKINIVNRPGIPQAKPMAGALVPPSAPFNVVPDPDGSSAPPATGSGS